ncbi:parapinopsin-like [Sceloporus undulatus]|uniref:parapinopsin-like n=1 Tax=Sceloporus undulatus TaxID=8520 RepID=UPI001C4BFF08|nr:parapinopsin-like [Sceloporus undulatus]XP_042313876.1 parapinopsin-like [Sceloporus undulatus]
MSEINANSTFNLTTLTDESRTGLSRMGHNIVAVFLGLILVFGFLNNLVVLILFCKFKTLRNPVNMLLLNISASDMLVCISGTTFSFISNIYGKWIGGEHGCRWYGFVNSCFGIVSLISLAILSYERYSTLTLTNKRGSDYQKALLGVGGSWLYSLIWTVPPLVGWSSYGLEGAGTSCSVRWTSETPESVSYIICLFIFCLAIPVMVMIYCYARLFYAVKQVGKIRKTSARKREFHVLFMVITTVICYLICWMPYGVIALLATFGRPGLVSPVASVIPSILAKSSTVCNPIIYILMNRQFYKCFLMLLHCQPPSVADGETICQSKVMTIQLNQKAQSGVTSKSQVVPQMDEKAICLLSPESSLEPVSENTPQLSKENSFL